MRNKFLFIYGMRIRHRDILGFEGVLSRYDKKTTVAIFVARFENRSIVMAQRRKDIFTSRAIDRARSSEYNIILTDDNNVYSDLINFIESHPLDKSDNNGGWGTREEIELVVR